jgi:cell division protease FtsH
MSDRIGPMAWGSQGMVFLGDDLMHSRDYSDETSRVIDEETERILREQEERATKVLGVHRRGLDMLAAALLEKETVDGAEVARLIDAAFGRPVHDAANGKAAAPVISSSEDPPLRGDTLPPSDLTPEERDEAPDPDATIPLPRPPR